MIRYIAHLSLVILLSLATLWVIKSDHRYVFVDSEITRQMHIPADFSGWHVRPGATHWHDRHQKILRLDAKGIDHYSFISKLVPNPQQFDNLMVNVEMRADSAFMQTPDSFGGTVLLCIDTQGHILTHWPQVIADVRHASTWQSFTRVIPVNSKCHKMALEIYMTADAGQVFAKNLSISAQSERGSFRLARTGAIVAWLFVLILTCRRIAKLRPSWWVNALVFAIGGAVIVGGTIPQPYLNDFLKTALYGSQDLYHSLTEDSKPSAKVRTNDNRPQSPANDTAADVSSLPSASQEISSDSVSTTAAASVPRAEVEKIPEFQLQPDTEALAQTYWTPKWKNLDKKEHILAFFVLGLLVIVVYRQFGLTRLLISLIVLSGAIQCVQNLSVTREFGLDDMVADGIGIFSSAIVVHLIHAGWRWLRPTGLSKPVLETSP